MPIEIRDERGANAVAWSGWDASLLDVLLDSETGSDAIGFTLARVLASRLLPSPTARFRFRLYRYCHDDGSYRFVGAWDERCLEDDAVPQSPEQLDREESRAEPPQLGTAIDQFLDDELFLPLETRSGVLGFGVLRVDSEHVPTRVPAQDLHFLGRLAGAGLSRLNESDRAVRMHRSFDSVSRHLDAVLAMAQDAFLLLDVRGYVQIANDAARTLLRRSGKELFGRRVSAVLPLEAADALHRALLAAEEADGRISAQIQLEHDGESADYEVVVQQLQPDLESEPTLLVRFRPVGDPSTRSLPEPLRSDSSPRPDSPRTRRQSEHAESLPATDEAETLRRHIRSIRGYLGLLREEVRPSGRDSDLFHHLELQLESLQAQSDVHALLESIRTGHVSWRDRSIRAATLIDRAVSRVSARLSSRGVEVARAVPSTTGRVRLDPEKWSILLAVLIDRATESPAVERVTVGLREDADLTITIDPDWSGDGPHPLTRGLGDDDYSHGLALVRHMVALHGGSLRTVNGAHGYPLVRLDLPLRGEDGRAA